MNLDPAAELPASARPPKSRTRVIWVVCILAAGLGLAGLAWSRDRAATKEAAKQGARTAMRAPPVMVASVMRSDVPLILEGLGTVTPIASVTIRSQVDGRLESVGFEEGKPVKRGQLLAQIDPRPFRIRVQEARATLARDRAQLQNAQLDLQRYEELSREKLVAGQQLDTQRAQVAQLLASLAMDEATVADAELQLQYTRITSPIDGVAGMRAVNPGNLVHASDTEGVVVVTQFDPIAVMFSLPQDELTKVSRALALGSPEVEVLDRAGQHVLGVGRLTVLDNQVNADTASLKLKAEFDNPDGALWPNQFVKARVEIELRKNVLSVPAEAISRGPQGEFVYVVGAGNKALQRPVTVDTIEGARALIAKGLQAGERVIIDGQDQVKPGAPVQPRAADAVAKSELAQPRLDRDAATPERVRAAPKGPL